MKKWLWEKDRKKALVWEIIQMGKRINMNFEEKKLMNHNIGHIETLHNKLCQYVSTIIAKDMPD